MFAKPLTNDQRKAAEAAFRGLPYNPSWSAEARAVYDGITKSTEGRVIVPDPELMELLQKVAGLPVPGETIPASLPADERPAAGVQASPESTSGEGVAAVPEGAVAELSGMTREEAVKVGYLIDVSTEARQMGLSLPVGLTKPLWDAGIAADDLIPEEQRQGRVRDLLMALRLHLERAAITTPFSEFAALLTFPPGTVPQVCPFFVLAHRDIAAPYCLTVLLPREVSIIRITPQN
jgi:hypothetical protein